MTDKKPPRLTVAQKAGWVRTGIYLPPNLYARVRAAAAMAHLTVSAYADQVFTAHLDRAEKRTKK